MAMYAHDLYVYGVPVLAAALIYLLWQWRPKPYSIHDWLAANILHEARGSVVTRLHRWPYPTPYKNRIVSPRVRRAVERGNVVYYQMRIPHDNYPR